MATHSSILAWRIPWTVGYSPWPCEESDTIEAAQHACTHLTAVLWEGMEAAILVTSLWLILPKVSGRCFSSSSAQITSVHWVLPHLSFPFSLPLLGIGFPGSSVGKESAFNARDLGLIPGLGRSPGEGKGYPLQYSGPENSMGCIHHEVIKSWT